MSKINRGEVWMIDLDPTKGREQAKKRPCRIISSNRFNQTPAELVIAIPITSKKKNIPLHVSVQPPYGGLKVISYLMCEQIRSISIERLDNYLGKIDEDTLIEVEGILKRLLDL